MKFSALSDDIFETWSFGIKKSVKYKFKKSSTYGND